MKMQRSTMLYSCLGLCIVFIIWVGFEAYLWFAPSKPSVQMLPQPVQREEATNIYEQYQLPASASNFWMASSSIAITGRLYVYRFDAPVEDCIHYANVCLATVEQGKVPSHCEMKDYVRDEAFLTFYPQAFQHFGLKTGLTWFDLDSVTEGLMGRCENGVFIVIDKKNGRFYFYRSD